MAEEKFVGEIAHPATITILVVGFDNFFVLCDVNVNLKEKNWFHKTDVEFQSHTFQTMKWIIIYV